MHKKFYTMERLSDTLNAQPSCALITPYSVKVRKNKSTPHMNEKTWYLVIAQVLRPVERTINPIEGFILDNLDNMTYE